MDKNQSFDLTEIVRSDSFVVGKEDVGLKPEFAFAVGCPDVDVRWFVTLIGIKVKSKRADSKDRRHGKS